MKIAIIFDAKTKGGGGFFQSLNSAIFLKRLESKIYKINFITTDRETMSILKKEGLTVIYFKKILSSKIFSKLYQISLFKFIFNFFKFNNPFSSFLKKNNFDFVIFLGPSWLITQCDEHNFISTIYDINFKLENYFPEYQSKLTFTIKNEIVNRSVNHGFKILVDTMKSKRELIQYYNCPEKKIIIQPFIPLLPTLEKNIEIENESKIIFNLGLEGKKFLFYPAQFWSHKNHKYIVDAIEILSKKDKNIKIVFCGTNKNNLDYIKKSIKEKNLENYFFILDFISNQEMIALYKNCIALVMPTYVARSTLPLYEAFYFKKIVLYSKDILDEELEKLVTTIDLNNPEDLSNKIVDLSKSDNFANKKVLDAFNHYLENCNESIFLNNYKTILDEYRYQVERWKNFS